MSTAAVIYIILQVVGVLAVILLHGERTEINAFASIITTGLICGPD